jgi:hypothetical protein
MQVWPISTSPNASDWWLTSFSRFATTLRIREGGSAAG